VIVLDASVWISSLLTTDVNHVRSDDWLVRVSTAGERFIVPSIFLPEVAGAFARRMGDKSAAAAALQRTLSSPAIAIAPIDVSLATAAARLALDLSLKGADAAYIALAVERGSSLVTWDRELITRAGTVAHVLEPT